MVYGSDSIGDWTISTEGHFKEANTPSHHLTSMLWRLMGEFLRNAGLGLQKMDLDPSHCSR